MGYNILLSDALSDKYPSLLPKLKALFNDNSAGEDVEVSTAPTFTSHAKAVQWADNFDVKGQAFTALWLDMDDLAIHLRDGTLSKFLDDFRCSQNLDDSATQTLLLVYAPSSTTTPAKYQIDVEMCRRELQFPCLHRMAESLDHAAYILHTYTHGMTPDRIHLVTRRYRNWKALRQGMKQIKPDVQAGNITLNSSLFSGMPPDKDSMENWVYNLYTFVVGDDPDAEFL
ncbi:hypothetical protein V5O48_003804 [Marasmius crinis-equi]|uniref:Uncharacterized protein n=1 Tax=Marasmius crinis-equi TaxID=585013 RepID=A0ABR3FS94_9AGAR